MPCGAAGKIFIEKGKNMNTVTAKRYQDLMQEFLKTPRSDVKGFKFLQ